MESEGVLKPVEVSDWATPIVCVPKTDGSVRICGDYKGTVNPAIQTEQFPIPTLEEIRGKVSAWKKFTKIDLRSAYQQLVLDEESQKLCTINTHKGLFQNTRLPFGISSSPAIWSTLYNSDGPQASRANLWPQESHPFLGSHASTALGYHSISL